MANNNGQYKKNYNILSKQNKTKIIKTKIKHLKCAFKHQNICNAQYGKIG